VIGLLQAYERMRARLPEANPLHLWSQASRQVFRDRAELFGDPDFVPVPTDRLLSAEYATQLAARVDPQRPLDLPRAVTAAREGDHTTHVSIVDREGMAIALTLTINVPFGSGLIVPGTGVLLNNQMDDFFTNGSRTCCRSSPTSIAPRYRVTRPNIPRSRCSRSVAFSSWRAHVTGYAVCPTAAIKARPGTELCSTSALVSDR